MKKWMCLSGLWLGYGLASGAAFAQSGGASSDSEWSPISQGDLHAGQITAQMCNACHDPNGQSAFAASPQLNGQHAAYLAKQLRDFQLGISSDGKQGRTDPIMGGIALTLTDTDIANVAAYYASLPVVSSAEKLPQNAAESERDYVEEHAQESSMQLGQRLYLAGEQPRQLAACRACHGFDASGLTSAGFPRLAGQNADYLASQLRHFRDKARHNDRNAMMRESSQALSDQEIEALAHYLSSLSVN